jgi:hypothetical protein
MFQGVGQKGNGKNMDFSWKQLYQAALLELKPEEMRRGIEAAERAIYQRVEELNQNDASSGEELWAIHDALRCLRVLAQSERQPQISTRAISQRSGVL